MMMGMFLLLGLHGAINHGIRPVLARREARTTRPVDETETVA